MPSTAIPTRVSTRLALDTTLLLSISLNQIAKKSYAAFRALSTYHITLVLPECMMIHLS